MSDRAKPYYQDEWTTIHHGDIRALAGELPECDLVLADPPYGETNLDWDVWPDTWPSIVGAVLQPTGSLWCFGSLKMFFAKLSEFESFTHAQEVVWEKHNGSNSAADRFRRVHELALHFYRGPWATIYKAPVYTQDAERRKIRRQVKPAHWNGISNNTYVSEPNGNRLLRSVIYARSCHGMALNPTQKPTTIICPLIEHSCPPGGLVLDAFTGSGSGLEAARRLGRRSIGVDKRESQCEIAAKRMEQMRREFDFNLKTKPS